mmetsp:Transcript_60980/g.108385  ORF Transcript_60980/g.108385 Transcript_60980/m.108385 type:complete len:272 (-) Transcript_60980:58-873(-)
MDSRVDSIPRHLAMASFFKVAFLSLIWGALLVASTPHGENEDTVDDPDPADPKERQLQTSVSEASPVNMRMLRLARLMRVVLWMPGIPGIEDGGATFNPALNPGLLQNLVSCLIQMCVGCCLFKSFSEKRAKWAQPNGEEFDGIFKCESDFKVCLSGCCCCVLRASQTAHIAGIKPFWTVMIIGSLLFFWPGFVGWGFFAAWRWHLRQQLRSLAGLPAEAGKDCLMVCCCSFCSVCQEARYVNKALANLPASTITIVGEPVGAVNTRFVSS